MTTITKKSETRVDIDLSGKLDADGMRQMLDELIAASEGVRSGRMLYRISEIALPTLGALGVEITRLPQLFSLIGKFDKCAVISDAGWIRNAAIFEGALIPGLAIKAFDLSEEAAAENWLSGP